MTFKAEESLALGCSDGAGRKLDLCQATCAVVVLAPYVLEMNSDYFRRVTDVLDRLKRDRSMFDEQSAYLLTRHIPMSTGSRWIAFRILSARSSLMVVATLFC